MYSVLIVDDEKIICEGIKHRIHMLNLSDISAINIACDSRKALELVRETRPDIIITDIRMPKINGIELIDLVTREDSHIKFIVLSGYDEYEYIRNAFKLGVIDYLLKPVSTADLEYYIKSAIQRLEDEKGEIICRQVSLQQNSEKTVVDIVKKYLGENFRKEINMTDISNMISMNYSYFSKLFKTQTGMTFTEYLTKLRMEDAKRLLDDPTNRISEISLQVGYEDAHNFSRAFKNYSGISPKDYRLKTHRTQGDGSSVH